MGKEAGFFSKFTSEVKGLWERQRQPKGLTKILSNLQQVPEQERALWAGKIFYRQVATLHDIREPERALNNLKIAGTLKEKFNLKWEDGEGASLEHRREQFVRGGIFTVMPAEGIALLVFLSRETNQTMKDFVKQETAKIKIDRIGYIFENFPEKIPEKNRIRGPFPTVHRKDNGGFDPYDPKTWKE